MNGITTDVKHLPVRVPVVFGLKDGQQPAEEENHKPDSSHTHD